jgi:hypothetical protein
MPAISVTEVYESVLTTTARAMMGDIRDNISRGNKLVSWLIEKGRFRSQSGGERIQVPLMYSLNSGADIFQGYGVLSTMPQDGITSAFFPWCQLAVPISISGLERKKNKGSSRIINLLEAKEKQAEVSGKELLNNCITTGRIVSGATGSRNQFGARLGTLDPSATGPLPLPALIDADPTRSVTIGEINGASGSNTWWRNQSLASTATTYRGYLQDKLRIYNMCSRGIMGAPDLVLSDQYIYEVYWNSLQNQERYVVTDERIINVLGGGDMLKFKNAIHVWDEVVPDVGTSTAHVVDSIGTLSNGGLQSGAHSTEYYINAQAMEFVYEEETNWAHTPFQTPVGQDATVAHMLWMGQVCINNRRKLGVLYDCANNIAS